jgi:hypothetical protein
MACATAPVCETCAPEYENVNGQCVPVVAPPPPPPPDDACMAAARRVCLDKSGACGTKISNAMARCKGPPAVFGGRLAPTGGLAPATLSAVFHHKPESGYVSRPVIGVDGRILGQTR